MSCKLCTSITLFVTYLSICINAVNLSLQKTPVKGSPARPPRSPEHIGIPVGGYQQKRQVLDEQRKHEYKEYLEKVLDIKQ